MSFEQTHFAIFALPSWINMSFSVETAPFINTTIFFFFLKIAMLIKESSTYDNYFFSCGRLIFALGRLKWTWKTLTQAGTRISLHSWNRKPSQVPTIITKINILFVYTLYPKFSFWCIKIVCVCLLLCLVILEEHHAKPTEKKRKLMYSLILT